MVPLKDEPGGRRKKLTGGITLPLKAMRGRFAYSAQRSRRFAYLAGLGEGGASFVVLRFSSKMRLISRTVSSFAKTV